MEYPEKEATEGTHEIYFVSSWKKIDTGWMEVLLRLQGWEGTHSPLYWRNVFSQIFLLLFFYYFLVFHIYNIFPGKMFSH